MTRLAIIGTSHVGAPRQGWERIRDRHPDVAIEFFAAPGHYFSLLELEPDLRLHLPDSVVAERAATYEAFERINGRMGIELASADVVVRLGYRWPRADISTLATTFDIDGVQPSGTGRMLSRPAFDAITEALAEAMLPPPQWRGWRAPRLVVAMAPAPAALPKGKQNRELADSRGRQLALATARGLFYDRLDAAFDAFGIGFYRQPEETLTPYGTTRPEFSRGAVRMRSGRQFPEEDQTHMNPDFGVIWMEGLLAWLDRKALQD